MASARARVRTPLGGGPLPVPASGGVVEGAVEGAARGHAVA